MTNALYRKWYREATAAQLSLGFDWYSNEFLTGTQFPYEKFSKKENKIIELAMADSHSAYREMIKENHPKYCAVWDRKSGTHSFDVLSDLEAKDAWEADDASIASTALERFKVYANTLLPRYEVMTCTAIWEAILSCGKKHEYSESWARKTFGDYKGMYVYARDVLKLPIIKRR